MGMSGCAGAAGVAVLRGRPRAINELEATGPAAAAALGAT